MEQSTVLNGTTYRARPDVARLLENCRSWDTRLRFHYGDQSTGLAWGDSEEGRIGRSTGQTKIPLVIKSKRSLGGGACWITAS